VAAQLSASTKKVQGALSGAGNLRIPVPLLAGVCGFAVLLAMASVIVGTWQARADEQAALQRYTDAEALLALPPVDLEALEAQNEAAQAALAEAKEQLEPPSVDPSSDEATSLLVERASTAGLTVRGVSRVPATEVKVDEVAYDVEGIRMTLEGGVSTLIGFLAGLNEQEPGVMPALTTMTVDEQSRGVADVTFNVYTEVVVPTPVAPAGGPE
jgi:hypothetical protein